MVGITAVLLHYRHWPDAQRAIDAAIDEVGIANLVIVDNGGESADMIRAVYPHCRLIAPPTNGGYAAGMNIGIRATEALGDRDVLLLTHDCVLRPGAVHALQARLDTAPDVGVVGPLLGLRTDPTVVYSKGGQIVGRNRSPQHLHGGEPMTHHDRSPPTSVAWLDGACLLIRRSVFDRIGLFDEDFFLYFEETDFLTRAHQLGIGIECVPAAVAWQQPGEGSSLRALWVRNRLRFVASNFGVRATAQQLFIDLKSAAKGPRRRETIRGIAAFLLRRTGALSA